MGASGINRNVFLLNIGMLIYKIVWICYYIYCNGIMGWNLPCIIKIPYHILFSNLPYACPEHCMSSYYKPVLSVYVQQPISDWTVMMANSGHYMMNMINYILIFFCVGVVYSGEYDVCDVTLSVYPHQESLKNMPGHGGLMFQRL